MVAPATGTKIDCEFTQLRAGGYTGSLTDMELAWLQNNGATSDQLGDAWEEFLAAQGFTTGNRSDDEYAYYVSLGLDVIAGASLMDMRKEFWCGAHNPP